MPKLCAISAVALTFVLGLSSAAHAQPASAAASASASANVPHQPIQQTEATSNGAGTTTTTVTRDGRRTEQITVEDGGSRVDELREGGETRHITVQPKNGSPAYDVRPPSSGAGDRSHNGGSGSSGARSWKLFQF